jgi:hypothetical protein
MEWWARDPEVEEIERIARHRETETGIYNAVVKIGRSWGCRIGKLRFTVEDGYVIHPEVKVKHSSLGTLYHSTGPGKCYVFREGPWVDVAIARANELIADDKAKTLQGFSKVDA